MPQFQQSQQATQSIPYAAAIDSNPDNGEYVIVGVLTGAITVNAPGNPQLGKVITYEFTQDATGTRVVTWNAIFKAAGFAPVTTANKINVASFRYNGTNWMLVSSAVGN